MQMLTDRESRPTDYSCENSEGNGRGGTNNESDGRLAQSSSSLISHPGGSSANTKRARDSPNQQPIAKSQSGHIPDHDESDFAH
jgi:hypothetical protein